MQSKDRLESSAFRVALAGYTNAGKSTLLNRLTGADVFTQDKLFATLDPTTRAYALPGGRLITVTDTVGFIQKLPHGLVEAFKSTLSEVLNADLILKVVDISDDDWIRQMDAVESVLSEIGAGDKLSVTVFNKVDLLDPIELGILKSRYPDSIFFSALTGEGIDSLTSRIANEASASDTVLSATIPYKEAALISLIREQGQVVHEEFQGEGVRLIARVPSRIAPRIERYITE